MLFRSIVEVIRARFLASALAGTRGRPVVVHVTNPLDAEPAQPDTPAVPVEPVAQERPEAPPHIEHGAVLTLDAGADIDPEIERLMAALDDSRTWDRMRAQEGAQPAGDGAQDPSGQGAQPEVRSPAQDDAQQVRDGGAQGVRSSSEGEVRTSRESGDAQPSAQADGREGTQGCAPQVNSSDGGAHRGRGEGAQPGDRELAQSGAQGAHDAVDGELRTPAQEGAHKVERKGAQTGPNRSSRTDAQVRTTQAAQATEETGTGTLNARDVAIHAMDEMYAGGDGTDPRTLTKKGLADELRVSRRTIDRALPEWCTRNGLTEKPENN